VRPISRSSSSWKHRARDRAQGGVGEALGPRPSRHGSFLRAPSGIGPSYGSVVNGSFKSRRTIHSFGLCELPTNIRSVLLNLHTQRETIVKNKKEIGRVAGAEPWGNPEPAQNRPLDPLADYRGGAVLTAELHMAAPIARVPGLPPDRRLSILVGLRRHGNRRGLNDANGASVIMKRWARTGAAHVKVPPRPRLYTNGGGVRGGWRPPRLQTRGGFFLSDFGRCAQRLWICLAIRRSMATILLQPPPRSAAASSNGANRQTNPPAAYPLAGQQNGSAHQLLVNLPTIVSVSACCGSCAGISGCLLMLAFSRPARTYFHASATPYPLRAGRRSRGVGGASILGGTGHYLGKPSRGALTLTLIVLPLLTAAQFRAVVLNISYGLIFFCSPYSIATDAALGAGVVERKCFMLGQKRSEFENSWTGSGKAYARACPRSSRIQGLVTY